MKLFTHALVALGIVGCLVAPAWARKPIKQLLTSTGQDPNAKGRTRLALRADDDGRFEIVVQKLDRNATFQVLVNGVLVGEITTTGGGNGKLRFRSKPHGHDVLLGFDPRGAHVEVRNADGQDVLDADFPSGDSAEGAIVCCIPDRHDDGEVECEDRTPAECTAKGGTVSTATSCLPNPCGGTSTPDDNDVVCCLPGGGDEAEVECEDRSQSDCVAQGGTVVSATSCTPDPCAATPPPPPADEVVCCVPDDRGAECEVLTSARCADRGGVTSTATACAPDTCTGTTPPAQNEVACCEPDHDGGTECELRTPDRCTARGGTPSSATSCTPNPCA